MLVISCENKRTVNDTHVADSAKRNHIAVGIANLQPLARGMIQKCIDTVSGCLNTTFSMTSEISFSTNMQVVEQLLKVSGVYDSAILSSSGVHVMSWEFKNLKDDLVVKNIAQLAATMQHSIDVSSAMAKLPLMVLGFLTSGRQWVMVRAILIGGIYKWMHTCPIDTIGPKDGRMEQEVDHEVCNQVAKLLSFAFGHAKQLHDETMAALLLQTGKSRGECSNPSSDDATPDADNRSDADDDQGADEVAKGGHNLRPNSHQAPKKNALQNDTNYIAPLTINNLQKYESMSWSKTPLDRFKTGPDLAALNVVRSMG